MCSINGGEVRLSQEHDAYKWVPVNRETVNMMYDAFKKRMEKWDWEEFLGKEVSAMGRLQDDYIRGCRSLSGAGTVI